MEVENILLMVVIWDNLYAPNRLGMDFHRICLGRAKELLNILHEKVKNQIPTEDNTQNNTKEEFNTEVQGSSNNVNLIVNINNTNKNNENTNNTDKNTINKQQLKMKTMDVNSFLKDDKNINSGDNKEIFDNKFNNNNNLNNRSSLPNAKDINSNNHNTNMKERKSVFKQK